MKEQLYCIYGILCEPTAEMYIGKTMDYKRRKLQHISALNSGKHYNVKMQDAFVKYGKSSFWFNTIEMGIPSWKINDREDYWIKYFNTIANGFNIFSASETVKHNPLGIKVIMDGKCFNSIAEAARHYGISRSAMAHRISKLRMNGLNVYGDEITNHAEPR